MRKYIKPSLECSEVATTCILQSSGASVSSNPMSIDKNNKADENAPVEAKHTIAPVSTTFFNYD